MKKFKTIEEAQKQIDKLIEEKKNLFCPAARNDCYGERCISFFKGSISKSIKNDRNEIVHYVYEPTCLSPLIDGVVTLEQ